MGDKQIDLKGILRVAGGLVLVWLLFVLWKWPFRREAVENALQNGTGDRIEIGGFRQTYFPPGCVIENLRVVNPRTPDFPALLVAKRVTISDNYPAILTAKRHVDAVDFAGLHLTIPPKGSDRSLRPQTPESKQTITIGEIRADDGTLDFLSENGNDVATRLEMGRLSLRDAGKQQRMTFHVTLRDPALAGQIRSAGRIGPWITGEIAGTPVSGTYTFQNADLSSLRGVSGMLNSEGKFGGTLQNVKCIGTVDVPDFRVATSAHSVHVSSNFTVIMNATTGTAEIEKAAAHFNRTTVLGSGAIHDSPPQRGKVLTLSVAVDDGHLEDFLLLFAKRVEPSMRGAIRFRANIVLPPKPPGFLERVRIVGDFHVHGSQFNNPKTQMTINRLSASAAGKPKQQLPELTYGDFQGHVDAENGIAWLSRVRLSDAGSAASLVGTFSLLDKTVNLTGVLRTRGKLADATSGFKSLVLKTVAPLWKHRSATSIIPFRITGDATHPHVILQLKRKMHL